MAEHFGVYAVKEYNSLSDLTDREIENLKKDFAKTKIQSVCLFIETDSFPDQASVNSSIQAQGGKIQGQTSGDEYSLYGPKGKPPGSTEPL